MQQILSLSLGSHHFVGNFRVAKRRTQKKTSFIVIPLESILQFVNRLKETPQK